MFIQKPEKTIKSFFNKSANKISNAINKVKQKVDRIKELTPLKSSVSLAKNLWQSTKDKLIHSRARFVTGYKEFKKDPKAYIGEKTDDLLIKIEKGLSKLLLLSRFYNYQT